MSTHTNNNSSLTGRNIQKTNYDDITLNSVLYDSKYMRNRGTLSQCVCSLRDMGSRLNKPTNEYQSLLYPKLTSECKLLVDYYNKLVSAVRKDDNDFFGFYLNGPLNNGKRKATNTLHENKTYFVSEYKETLRTLNDRLRHIKKDCIHKKNSNNDTNVTDLDIVERMITFCDDFHKEVDTRLNEWNEFIQNARTANNIVKTDNAATNNYTTTGNTTNSNATTMNTRTTKDKDNLKVISSRVNLTKFNAKKPVSKSSVKSSEKQFSEKQFSGK